MSWRTGFGPTLMVPEEQSFELFKDKLLRSSPQRSFEQYEHKHGHSDAFTQVAKSLQTYDTGFSRLFELQARDWANILEGPHGMQARKPCHDAVPLFMPGEDKVRHFIVGELNPEFESSESLKGLIPNGIVLLSFEDPVQTRNAVFGFIAGRFGTCLEIEWMAEENHPFSRAMRQAQSQSECPRVKLRYLHSLTDTKRYFDSIEGLKANQAFLLADAAANFNFFAVPLSNNEKEALGVLSRNLNKSQRDALQRACDQSEHVTLIRTPPGTESDKLQLINAMLTFYSQTLQKTVLVCAPTKGGVEDIKSAAHGYDSRSSRLHFCTVSAAGKLRAKWQPDLVVIDDAVRLHEYQALIPVSLGRDKFVLLGDPTRLQATVPASLMPIPAFQISLFERLMDKGYHTVALQRQDRMDPRIADLRRKHTGVDVIDSAEVSTYEYQWEHQFFWLYESKLRRHFDTIRFVFVRDSAEEICQNQSYKNYKEARAVAKHLERILDSARDAIAGNWIKAVPSIGFLSPYTGQIRLMKTMVKHLLEKYEFRRYQTKIWERLAFHTIDSDTAQRACFDIVLLSCVRTSNYRFLTESRRMNVALTRANHMLAVFGRDNTLLRDVDDPCRYQTEIESESLSSFFVHDSRSG
ncbi:MAG: hypothetical protein MHM6MM_003076 [Cercozoa sp. M6MM]